MLWKNQSLADTLFYKRQTCRSFGKNGHIVKMCRKSTTTQQKALVVNERESYLDDGNQELLLLKISVFKLINHQAGFIVDMKIEQKLLVVEQDTGASVSRVKLNANSWQGLFVLDRQIIQIKYGKQKAKLLLMVVKGNGTSSFCSNWLESMQIDWGSIKQVSSQLDQLPSEHQSDF